MYENDPHWDADPIWYDRTESDPAPGPVVLALATLFLLATAGCVAALRIYWLPDRLWRSASRWIARRERTRTGRS